MSSRETVSASLFALEALIEGGGGEQEASLPFPSLLEAPHTPTNEQLT